MLEGWRMRYKDQQNLFVTYVAMPLINIFSKKKVKYEDFFNEGTADEYSDLTLEELQELATDETN